MPLQVGHKLRMFVREDIHAAKEQKKKHSRVRMQLESAQNDLESAKANKKVTKGGAGGGVCNGTDLLPGI